MQSKKKRSVRFTILLTPNEAAALAEMSEKLGMTPSEYIRSRTVGNSEQLLELLGGNDD